MVRFEENDLFEADIRPATVVTLFLLSSVNLKLRPKLLADLKPGARVVSNTFDMGDWKPDKDVYVGVSGSERMAEPPPVLLDHPGEEMSRWIAGGAGPNFYCGLRSYAERDANSERPMSEA